MEEKRKRVSFLGPVLLIAVGGILLLNTLGFLEWSIWWTILRLWPVLLIAAGLELLLGRRSVWGSVLATMLVLAVLFGAVWLSQSDTVRNTLPSQEIRQPLGNATQAEVAIEPGVGTLRMEAARESANLIEGTIRLVKGEEATEAFSQQGNRATYSLNTGGEAWVPFSGGWDNRRVWELGLSPGAALQLRTDVGAGETVLDLSGLILSDLASTMGLGHTKVTLPADSEFTGQVDQAIGVVEIIVPQGLPLRLQAETALAGRQVPDDFQREGDNVFLSPSYASSDNQVDLKVSVAIGLLTVSYSE
jgi:hypothetical protein